MPIYPLRFQLGPLEITGFGIMMMLAFLSSGWVMERELSRRRLAPDYAWSIVVAGALGGILGAKLWYFALHHSVSALFSRSGLVWYGGFFGGLLGVIINGWRLKVPTKFTAELTAPALAVGYALGRIGCFLVQDDYGVPTTLPWGMQFPEGQPPTLARHLASFGVDLPPNTNPLELLAVHPTQLYEASAMMLAFWLLWRFRGHGRAEGWLFGLYLAIAGLERFLVEFLRAKDDRLLGSLTVSQAASLAVIAAGVTLLIARSGPSQEPDRPPAAILRLSP